MAMYYWQRISWRSMSNGGLTPIMQTLLKNLFNSSTTRRDDLLGVSLLVIFIKIFRKPSVKGTLKYRKINFFTTSALCRCIFRVNHLYLVIPTD